MYQPLPEELGDSERGFLGRLAPFGLDFLTTRQRYRELFGARSYHGWRDVIALPETRALSSTPLCFVMYADEQLMDLAPEYLWADYLRHDDARANHRDMVQQLSAALGAPVVCDVSNCLQCRWDFGVFRVELHTFPPELQRPSKNLLHELNPRLALGASISIHSELAFPYPDGSLEPLANALRLRDASVLAMNWQPSFGELRRSLRYERRAPRSLESALSGVGLLAWRDEANGRLGLSTRARSLVFDGLEVEGLSLVHFEPDRGPSGVRLELRLGSGLASRPRTVTLLEIGLEAAADGKLARAGAQLAGHFRLELAERREDGW